MLCTMLWYMRFEYTVYNLLLTSYLIILLYYTGNVIGMLSGGYFGVISPEGAASILGALI